MPLANEIILPVGEELKSDTRSIVPTGTNIIPAGVRMPPVVSTMLPAGVQMLPAGVQMLPAGGTIILSTMNMQEHEQKLFLPQRETEGDPDYS